MYKFEVRIQNSTSSLTYSLMCLSLCVYVDPLIYVFLVLINDVSFAGLSIQAFCDPLQGFCNAILFIFMSKVISKRVITAIKSRLRLLWDANCEVYRSNLKQSPNVPNERHPLIEHKSDTSFWRLVRILLYNSSYHWLITSIDIHVSIAILHILMQREQSKLYCINFMPSITIL